MILTGVALTVCFTEGSTLPNSITVPCGEGRYRHNPYCPVLYLQLSPEHLVLSAGANADEPTTTIHRVRPADGISPQAKLPTTRGNLGSSIGDDGAATLSLLHTIMPQAALTLFQGGVRLVAPTQTPISLSHPLYQTLVNGAPPRSNLVETIEDCSVFTFTAEMAKHPQVLENYATHIAPQLKKFVGMRFQNECVHNKQIQIYEILSDFFFRTENLKEAVYMLIGKANIYSIRSQNIQAFNALEPSIESIDTMEESQNNKSMLGTVFLMMVRAVYYMRNEERVIYKPILDRHYSLCRQHINVGMLEPNHILRLKALSYFDQLEKK